jgi:hypothetical protein
MVSSYLTGGRTLYGLALGILMLDTTFPRLPGDVGNATTWPFPVAYSIVRGARPERLVQPDADPALLEPFVVAAKELAELGVPAIITSCGFLAAYQRELSGAVPVPVFTSALLQVPMAAAAIPPGNRVAILTIRPVLGERHFAGTGWSQRDIPVVQVAPPTDSHLFETFVGDAPQADVRRLEREIDELTRTVMHEHPDVGAILVECVAFAPFTGIVRRISGLPVFDAYTLGMHAHLVTSPAPTRFGAVQ